MRSIFFVLVLALFSVGCAARVVSAPPEQRDAGVAQHEPDAGACLPGAGWEDPASGCGAVTCEARDGACACTAVCGRGQQVAAQCIGGACECSADGRPPPGGTVCEEGDAGAACCLGFLR